MSSPAQPPRLAILGLGKMGSILLQAFCQQNVVNPANVVATVNHSERVDALAVEIRRTGHHRQSRRREGRRRHPAVRQAPDSGRRGARDRAGTARERQLIISIAASVPTSYIEQRIPAKIPVVRAMPNTPSRVGAGMTAFCCGSVGEAR